MSRVDLAMIDERYRILELLGSGSMGTVYRVVDQRTGDEVALKRVSPAASIGLPHTQEEVEEDRRALKREFQLLASLYHPHIIGVYECGFDENQQPFYTMDYLEGETILVYGQDQPLAVKLNLLAQMFDALAYLHEQDVLQHDLKPENILVADGQVKLTDFGLAACELHLSPAVTNLQGTAAYMAPEMLKGEHSSKASDIYAGGVIAYELLAGRHPFNVKNMNRLILSVLHDEPDLAILPENEDLRALVGALLAHEPGERIQNADAVVEALMNIKRKGQEKEN